MPNIYNEDGSVTEVDDDGNPIDGEDFSFGGGSLSVDGFTGGNSQNVFAPDLRESYTNPDPTAKRVGTDASGNPVWNLIDKGGNLIEWAVNAAGEAVGVQSKGAAGFDNRLTYQPPAQAKPVGIDAATGNPLFQLVDEGGRLLRYGVNWLGEVVGLTDITPAKAAPPSVVAPDPLKTGDPGSSLITSLLTGDKPGGGTVTNVNTNTDARQWLNTNIDSSNRSVSNTTVSTNVNTAGLVSQVVDSISALFKGQTPAAVAGAPGMLPSDDTLFGSRSQPGAYASGQVTNWAASKPGSNALTQSPSGTITGDFGKTATNFVNENKTLVFLSLLVGVVSLFFILKKRRA